MGHLAGKPVPAFLVPSNPAIHPHSRSPPQPPAKEGSRENISHLGPSLYLGCQTRCADHARVRRGARWGARAGCETHVACLHWLPFPPLKRPGFRERFFYIIKLCVMTRWHWNDGDPGRISQATAGCKGHWAMELCQAECPDSKRRMDPKWHLPQRELVFFVHISAFFSTPRSNQGGGERAREVSPWRPESSGGGPYTKVRAP